LLRLLPAGGFFDGVWSIQLAYLLRVTDSFDRDMHTLFFCAGEVCDHFVRAVQTY